MGRFSKKHRPSDFKKIMYRVDPPVDLGYLHPLQMLVAATATGTEIVNSPPTLLTSNEKWLALGLGKLFPKSCVSSQQETLTSFLKDQGQAVLKPLHDAQSHGVELLDWNKNSARAIRLIRRATQGFTRPVILQEYLSQVLEGETRLWFLNGKLLAWIRKKPLPGKF